MVLRRMDIHNNGNRSNNTSMRRIDSNSNNTSRISNNNNAGKRPMGQAVAVKIRVNEVDGSPSVASAQHMLAAAQDDECSSHGAHQF
eukprot:scaffold19178_cov31-Prasinocladus_malaysianus.AAC.1